MPISPILQNLRIPVIGAPMFIVSVPGADRAVQGGDARLVGAQCTQELLGEWIVRQTELADCYGANPGKKVAPSPSTRSAKTNTRLEHDMAVCVKHQVPIITSSRAAGNHPGRAPGGGIVLHDVISIRHAQKAVGEGDGSIRRAALALAATRNARPSRLSPKSGNGSAGPLALSGAIANGASISARRRSGADCLVVARPSLPKEANADLNKEAISASRRRRYSCTPTCSPAAQRPQVLHPRRCRLDLGKSPQSDAQNELRLGRPKAKAWKDIWGAGQGVGQIVDVPSVADLVDRLEREYAEARARLCGEKATSRG
ncbi:MAG: nitronate monooxygenase [Alphaproteobacteria bacterium]